MRHERNVEAEPLTEIQNELGEGPLWDPRGRLFWTDINARRLHLLNSATGEEETARLEVKVGCMGLRKEGGLVLATDRGFALYSVQDGFGGVEPKFLGDPEADLPHTRFNDGAVDPGGRFWAGSYGGESNSLYRLDPDGGVHKIDTGFGVPNGTDWSLDAKVMYFTDSDAKTIYAYDFDAQTGEVENRRPLIVTKDADGVPDGLTVDAEGFLWSARYGGGRLERYDPDGRLERTLNLPVSQPTSLAFGGRGLHELFVTSAREGLSEEALREQPLAGRLFRVRPGVRGREAFRFGG